MTEKLMELREAKKSKKPAFVTQDSWKRKRLPTSWRRPKGMHSKMRLKHKGNPKIPSHGYRSPRLVRHFHPSGLVPVVISSIKQLNKIKDEGVIISSAVGIKKRLALIKAATEKKLTILNLNKDYAAKAETAFSERKKKKSAVTAAQASTEPKKQEKKETEPKKEEKETEEEKRKTAKKEMEKIITRPEK